MNMDWRIYLGITSLAIGFGIYWFTRQYSNPNQIINDDKILFIGLPGQGKTKLFDKISGNKKVLKEPFNNYKLKNTNFSLVDTPSIDFEDNIDRREKIIELFQIHFKEISYRVSLFLIFVKFERTDIMKKNITAIYKYFHKFHNIIRIIVTDFQYSESEQEDKEHLQNAFRLFVNDNQKHILFFRNDTPKEDIMSQLLDQISNIQQTEPIDLKDTILEEHSEEEQRIQMDKIYKMVSQNDKQ